MKDILMEIISNYGMEIISVILTGIVTFIGTALKKLYEDKVKDETKRKVIRDCVKSVEQIYKNLHGSDKLHKAMENATDILADKGISVTELELITTIESALAEFNNAFDKASWKEGVEEIVEGEYVI